MGVYLIRYQRKNVRGLKEKMCAKVMGMPSCHCFVTVADNAMACLRCHMKMGRHSETVIAVDSCDASVRRDLTRHELVRFIL